MRPIPLIFALLPLLPLVSEAQEEAASPTETLKDSIREWIETMKEVQVEENSWERDQELLTAQKEALETEIADLEKQIATAEEAKAGADKASLEKEERRDAFLESKEVLSAKVRTLEEGVLARLSALPVPMADELRVAQLVTEIKADAKLSGDDKDDKLAKRLTNVLNLLAEAEKWQQTVHLKEELRETGDGRKLNMKTVYFGLAGAYSVDGEGAFALVGEPGVSGWEFKEAGELAPRISEMVKVLNGDADAKFISLPISLP